MNLKGIDIHAIANQEQIELKEGFSIDSIKRTNAMYAGLSGISVAGIFTCIGANVTSNFLIAAVCCYSICLPALVACYLFNEMQLGRGTRKFLEYREVVHDKKTLKLISPIWVVLITGLSLSIMHVSVLAGCLFLVSIIVSAVLFYFYYFKQLSMEMPSNTYQAPGRQE